LAKQNKTAMQALDTQVIAGINKDLKNTKSLLLAGSTYTPVTLTALIQSRITAINEVATTRAAWLAAVAAFDTLSAQVHEVEMGLKQYAFNAFGKKSPLLADFGFAAPKVVTPTTDTKQLAIQKRAATRVARNTLSKKAKAKITGTVATPAQPAAPTAPATAPAPVTQPAAPAPAPTVPTPPPATPPAPPKS